MTFSDEERSVLRNALDIMLARPKPNKPTNGKPNPADWRRRAIAEELYTKLRIEA